MPEQEGRYAYEGLDRLIHERARLSVLTSLLTHPKGLTFVELKGMCSLTDGNLSRHLSILETDGMVKIEKGHESKVAPNSDFRRRQTREPDHHSAGGRRGHQQARPLPPGGKNRPQTLCRITGPGRKRYMEYLQTLEQVIKDAAKVAEESTSHTRGKMPKLILG